MSKMTVSDLEFDDIKDNLKNFLKDQTEFTDYNFEGSALSILLDVLSYTTHYNALYDNMLVNESFLDSASKRSSVVSRANELGYTPKSASCSKITVDIKFKPKDNISLDTPPMSIVIPKYTTFTSTNGYKIIRFCNLDDIILNRTTSDVEWIATDVTLYAGIPSKYSFKVTTNSKYIIPNQNVDISTLRVVVFDDSTATSSSSIFSHVDSFLNIDEFSRIYWLKEIEGLYELKFGNGVLGKKLVVDNLITTEYMIASGPEANGIKSLTYAGSIRINANDSPFDIDATVTTKGPSFNGADIEDIDSIKFNAPRHYYTQNRAVTTEDYKNIVLSKFSDARSVSVWGGEDNVPPVYGKVFIAVSQHSNKKLSLVQKEEIKTLLRSKKVVAVIPEVVDAEYINIILNIKAYFNKFETTLPASSIRTKIIDAVSDYNEKNLQSFDKILRESRLSRVIDSADKSILSSKFDMKIRIDIDPRFNIESRYDVNIINPITPGTIISNGLYIPNIENLVFIEDNSEGILRVVYYDINSNKIILNDNIGSVDYELGIISIQALEIVALNSGDYITLTFTPKNKDVISALTKIVKIDVLNVDVIDDMSANGDLRAGFNFQF